MRIIDLLLGSLALALFLLGVSLSCYFYCWCIEQLYAP